MIAIEIVKIPRPPLTAAPKLNNLITTLYPRTPTSPPLRRNLLALALMCANLFWFNIKRILINVLDTLKLRSVTFPSILLYQTRKICILLGATCKGRRRSCCRSTWRYTEVWRELKSKFMTTTKTRLSEVVASEGGHASVAGWGCGVWCAESHCRMLPRACSK